MSGTTAGGLKAKETILKKQGEDFYAKIGSIGGKATGKKGFAASGKAVEAGKKSKRDYKLIKETPKYLIYTDKQGKEVRIKK